MKLTVNLKENSYPIYIENGILNRAGEYIADLFHGQRIMIVSDDNVFPLYGKQLCDSLSGYEYKLGIKIVLLGKSNQSDIAVQNCIAA